VPRFLTIAAASVLLCAAIHHAAAQGTAHWNLANLMSAMHQVRSSNARFVETRHLHLLNQPQQSSGQLLYVAPDYLQKTTTEPSASRLTIRGDRLTIEQQGQPTRAIALQDYSEIGTMVDSTRAILAGDLPALTRSFTTAFAGSPEGWTLTLEPRDTKLREIVTSIRIQGMRDTIREVLTLQANGDRTDMIVTPEPK
jgi:outer membrane lipoprotein carrier protein LolA